jgi:DNA-binding MarR family transcriptional regulator
MSQDETLNQIESGLTALHRAFFQHKSWEELQRESGVSLERPEAALLKVLAMHEHGSCRMQQIAAYLGIEAPSVTRTAQQLEEYGLVKKQPDRHDRRAMQVRMTNRGRQQLRRLQQYRHTQLAEVFKRWSPEDRNKFADYLRRLADDLAA